MSGKAKTITVTDLRNCTRTVLEDVHFRGRRYVIERAGQPMAVILDVTEYEGLAGALPPLSMAAVDRSFSQE
jgi:prevent-host-death family protein